MPSFALTAIGRDRPGIVAAVAEVLYGLGCNIEDSSMALLRGNFSIMLVLSAPPSTTTTDLQDALSGPSTSLGLTVSVVAVEDTPGSARPSHILTVYGADKPGILYRVAEAVAALGVNITDLTSRIVGAADEPVYAMLLELAFPDTTSLGAAESALRSLAAEIGIDLSLNVVDEDVL